VGMSDGCMGFSLTDAGHGGVRLVGLCFCPCCCSGADPPEVNCPLDSNTGMFMSDVWSDN
jgi:hypothetical protein